VQLQQLSYVLAVAEEESFTRAADRLRLAQPSLSRAVRLLEQELGVLIFNRGPGQGRVTLTPDGWWPTSRPPEPRRGHSRAWRAAAWPSAPRPAW